MAGATPAKLPVPLTSLVGREREVALATAVLRRPDVRLVTLTGPGGVGKTRLAIRIAEQTDAVFPDGRWFVPLAPVREAGLVASAVALALGVREEGSRPILQGIAAFLRDRRALLVLDNFEHVLDAAPLVTDLLAACPGLTVLATSRAVLRLTGEHDLGVPPLSLPSRAGEMSRSREVNGALLDSSPARVLDSEAVRLFVERAAAAKVEFALPDTDAPTVAAICHRLDGLPLAIELAAARIRHLPPSAILARLDRRLALLTGGGQDQPPRLRSMRDAIAWSHDLLTPEEQTLFRRLAAFVGGCTLAAAEAVAAAAGDPGIDVLEGVSSLVDKSLLRQEVGSAGEARYAMLETVREYGLERLAASGEEQSVRDAHAEHYLALSQHLEPLLFSEGQAAASAHLMAELPNLRAALGWLHERGRSEAVLRLASALFMFWYTRADPWELRRWLGAGLTDEAVPVEVRSEALVHAANTASLQGDLDQATRQGEDALALARAAGHTRGVALALLSLGATKKWQGDLASAAPLLEEAVTLLRGLDNRHWLATALHNLAETTLWRGDAARAHSLAEEALALWRDRGNEWGRAIGTGDAAVVACARGDHGRATALFAEALAFWEALGDRRGTAGVLAGLAAVAWATGDRERAARLLGAAEAVAATVAIRLLAYHLQYERVRDAVYGRTNEPAIAAALAEGRSLSPEQAIAEARSLIADLENAPTARTGGTSPGEEFTPREQEVLRLLAEGRSDREIGEALFISPKTAGFHVGHILAKLGVETRAAAAALAVRRGLV